jgi:hypothetical protein
MSILDERMDYQPDDDERAVLDVLRDEGRVNPLRIRERTDIRKQYVNDALRQLQKLGVVRNVNRGLYEYVPEEDDLPGAPAGDMDGDVRRALDELEAALERGDRTAAETAYETLGEALRR